MKVNVHCWVEGDVVIECLYQRGRLHHEEMIFRVMFNTLFIQNKTLVLSRDDIDIFWNSKEPFSRDFKAEVDT